MYELSVCDTFSAAHRLRGYKGKCEQLHGHNWKVEVVVSSSGVGKLGIAIDFKHLRALLSRELAEMDHSNLNELEAFRKVNPSSENIARHIHRKLGRVLPRKGVSLRKVVVWESESCSAAYCR